MQTINASKNVRQQRQDALAEQYVEVRQKGTTQAVRAEQGIELHNDDGSISVARPGDWVVERADGTMGIVPVKEFVEFYEPAGDSAKEPYDLSVADAQGPENNDTGEPIPFAGEPEDTGGIRVGSDGLADHERTAGAEDQAALLEQLQAQVNEVSDTARRLQLVSDEEHAAWRETGEPPAGVKVEKVDGELVVTREEGNGPATQTADPAQTSDPAGDPAPEPDPAAAAPAPPEDPAEPSPAAA